jgi:transposase
MNTVEIITTVQRRYRWIAEQEKEFALETEQPGMSLSTVARQYSKGRSKS